MPMELWILAAVAGCGLALIGVARLRRMRRREADETKNIYTLW
jgi:DNA transposition AAA+ family ATPase